MKRFCLLLLLPVTSQAATYAGTENIGQVIPDNNLSGLTSSVAVSGDSTSITSVQVVLNLSNAVAGWSGDIYCTLTHSTGFSVLLNRIGRTTAFPAGNGNTSLSLTLSDTGLGGDVHAATPTTGALAGAYQPDGRNVSPTSTTAVMDAATRTASLGAAFNTMDSNGTWTLALFDVAPGSTMALNSWSLTINPVPEPSAAGLAAMGLVSLVLRRRRR